MPVITPDLSWAGAVRVRAAAADPHAGLRGHAYIAARGLNQPAQRLNDGAAHHAERVHNILAQWRPSAVVLPLHAVRRRSGQHQGR